MKRNGISKGAFFGLAAALSVSIAGCDSANNGMTKEQIERQDRVNQLKLEEAEKEKQRKEKSDEYRKKLLTPNW
jgi:hypothetical protein